MRVSGEEGYEGRVVVGRNPWEGWKVVEMNEMEGGTVVLPPNVCELPEGKLRDYAKMMGKRRDLEVEKTSYSRMIGAEDQGGTQKEMLEYLKARVDDLETKDDDAWCAIRRRLSNDGERAEYLEGLEAEVKHYLIANNDRALREWMKEFSRLMLLQV